MNFKELINKYLENDINKDEKQFVEEEIEKYKAIEDYLINHSDLGFSLGFQSGVEEDEIKHFNESVKIKKSIDSRLRKLVLSSTATVLSLLIGLFFIISPLLDSLYYNPGKVDVGEVEADINFDIQAFTELNYPGYALSSLVNIDKHGFASYDIYYFRTNLFTGEVNYINSKLKRNKYITDHTSWTNNRKLNFESVRIPDWIEEGDFVEQKNRVLNHVKQLSPVAYISSWLSFNKDLSMEELHKLQIKYPEIDFVWIGVRTSPANETIFDLLGFSPRSNVKISSDKPNTEKYPAFDFINWLVNPSEFDSGVKFLEPRGYELHFQDLLRYMADRKKNTDVLEGQPYKHQYYEKSLNFVKENGVKSYGVLTYANAENLIDFIENEEILTLELDQILASKPHVN